MDRETALVMAIEYEYKILGRAMMHFLVIADHTAGPFRITKPWGGEQRRVG